MKRIIPTAGLLAVSAMTLFAQGRVLFNNLVSSNGITVGIYNQGASGGVSGQFVGNNYSVQLWWAPGTYADYQSFFTAVAANTNLSPAFALFGTTGGSPTTDGAGLFDGGVVDIGPAGIYTMQAVAWYNNGRFATYFHALAGGANIGQSQLIQIDVTAPPTGAPDTLFPSFTVGALAPEPSTLALVAIGAACLLFCRSRN